LSLYSNRLKLNGYANFTRITMGTINPMNICRLIRDDLKQWLTETGAYLKDDFDTNYDNDHQLSRFLTTLVKDEYLGLNRLQSLEEFYNQQYTIKSELDFGEDSNELIESLLDRVNEVGESKNDEVLEVFRVFMKRVHGEKFERDESCCADYAPIHLIHEVLDVNSVNGGSDTEDSDFEPDDDYEPRAKRRRSQMIFTRAEKEEIVDFAFVPGEGNEKVMKKLADIQEIYPKIKCLNDVYRLKKLLKKEGQRKPKESDDEGNDESKS